MIRAGLCDSARKSNWVRVSTIALLLSIAGCAEVALQPWHSHRLVEEYSAASRDEVNSFDDYLRLEDRLFAELQEEVYARVGTGPKFALVRYSRGSLADPEDDEPNWNRSFELATEAPIGGVLLLHGMSDSPYSLRALAKTLSEQGYWVLGLRLPGHGTAPSGLRHITIQDMTGAVRLAMKHLAAKLEGIPIHIVGYSTGAALALDFALDEIEGKVSPKPASLVLISPAIRIHPSAALARFKNGLSIVPGLGGLAWLQVHPEFDPYKYNSFATNAGSLVHRLTKSVDRRIASRFRPDRGDVQLPPILVFKSTVDATVTTRAVVDRLLALLSSHRHELVLFDINRLAAKSTLLVADPGPLTDRLLLDDTLPFGVTVVTNADENTRAVVARHKAPFSSDVADQEPLGLSWPMGVISLSHLALSIPPDDPLYGSRPLGNEGLLFLGDMPMRGERGLINLPGDWLLRMRYNPFYDVIEKRVIEWFELDHDQTARP